MALNVDALLSAQLLHRTEAVSVPDLQQWFPEGEDPEWVVRGLSANEYAAAKEAETGRVAETMRALTNAVAKRGGQQVRDFQKALGYDGETKPDIARRLEALCLGSVSPECPSNLAAFLAEHFTAEFYEITNTIEKLTRLGSEEAKKKPSTSGKTQK